MTNRITSAEVLTPDNRKLIEQTFGCPVILLVETLAARTTPAGTPGEIVVTDLQNLAISGQRPCLVRAIAR